MIKPLLAVAYLLAVPVAAFAEGPAAAPTPYAIGATVADFSAQDLGGGDVSLSGLRAITPDSALAAAKAAAAFFAAKDPKPETLIDSLPGTLKADGTYAPVKRLAFLKEVGRPFGLVADAKRAEASKNLADAAKWIEGSAKAPIAFMFWSAKCPVMAAYNDRVAQIFAETGARLLMVDANVNDTDLDIRTSLSKSGHGFQVLVDRQQKVCDLFGGQRTPHVFLLDAKNVLRYTGGIDDDPVEEKGAARQDWLKNAIDQVAAGKEVAVPTTLPKGCKIARPK